jgi:L-aminopeptidase/D-esterase-like protein
MSQYAISVVSGTLQDSIPHLSYLAAEAIGEAVVDALIAADAADFGGRD